MLATFSRHKFTREVQTGEGFDAAYVSLVAFGVELLGVQLQSEKKLR
jgi:hypothetical protein